MLLPAVCAVLTAIQSFPLEEWQAASVDEYAGRARKTATADVSSKLGWNLHVQPLGNKARHKPKSVKNYDGGSSTLHSISKTATPGKPPHLDSATLKTLLAEADRFVDALNKQLKPTNATGRPAPKTKPRNTDTTLKFGKSKGTTSLPSVSFLSHERKPTSTAKPSCEKGKYPPIGSRVSRIHKSGDAAVLTNDTGRTASSSASMDINPGPTSRPTLNGSVVNQFASPPPLNQSKTHGSRAAHQKPSARIIESTRTSPNPAVTPPKNRRRLRVRPKSIRPPAQPQPVDLLKSRAVGTEPSATHLFDRVNNTKNDATLTPKAASNSSKPKRLRRRKKRPKLNLFQPGSRQPAAVQNWTSAPGRCRTAEVWRLSGRCGNATVNVERPGQRQRPEDHMTESSVVRPRIYGLNPGAESGERGSHFSQPTTGGSRHFHRPPAHRESHESREDYYDYSPEYHDDYFSGESLEDFSDEASRETGRDDRDAVGPDAPSEGQSLPKTDANTTVEEAKSNTKARETIGETVRFNTTSANGIPGVEDSAAPRATRSHLLRDTEEGFKLLIHEDSNLPSGDPTQTTTNSTAAEEKPDRSPREIQPPPTDPTPEAASDLTAMYPGVQVTRASASVLDEVQEASSDRRDKGGGMSSGFFSFAEVPAPGHHRFGYRKGNDQHFTGRLELADGPHVKAVVVWADRKGGYGKHIWDYNHKDHKD
ncbi:uncharacterized protein LOC144098491 [Amblyomma americanum]